MKPDGKITLTIDLEDYTGIYAQNGRYIPMTKHILSLCDDFECKATFFAVGRIIDSAPALIREISERGHEIAYHSHNHIPLTEENPVRMKQESREDKDKIEQITGKPVIGYRAPQYSLTPETSWALDILAELGFVYSSSIMPTSLSRFGFKQTPRTPFKWPNGLWEFPLPVKKIGPMLIPYSGGVYLYLMPSFMSRKFISKADKDEVIWTYAHPYDFDRKETPQPMPSTPVWISKILWLSRKVAEKKIRKVISYGIGSPLKERLENL